MIPDIAARLDEMFARGVKPRLARSVNASAIGHPCARCLVFDQCRVSEGDASAEPIFALGRTLERQAMIDLQDALAGTGIEVVQQQRPIPPNPYGIGGIIDVFFRYDDNGKRRVVPGEFKSMSPFVFDSVNTLEDMTTHRSPYVRKYPGQLMIYMLMSNEEDGLFLLRNKVTGRYKQINVALDYEYCEELLQKARLVTDSVAAYHAAKSDEERVKALPPRIAFDPSICPNCSHYDVCIPDPNTLPEADARLWDVALDAMCRRVKELDAAVDEREELMEKIKAHAQQLVADAPEGTKRTSITDHYFVSASVYKTTQYAVPDDVKAPYRTSGRAVRVSIEPVDTQASTP